MQRRVTYSAVAVAVIALALSVFLIGPSPSPPRAGAADTTTTTTTTTTTLPSTPPVAGFYLDIGGSASLGVQPDGAAHHNGHRTNEGYANDVKDLEAQNVTLTLHQVGCPGETVQSMLGLLKNTCYHLPVTQLMLSVQVLTADSDEPGLVTIEIGRASC